MSVDDRIKISKHVMGKLKQYYPTIPLNVRSRAPLPHPLAATDFAWLAGCLGAHFVPRACGWFRSHAATTPTCEGGVRSRTALAGVHVLTLLVVLCDGITRWLGTCAGDGTLVGPCWLVGAGCAFFFLSPCPITDA